MDFLEKPGDTISLTFGDAGENHAGMEMIGERANNGDGFNMEDLAIIADKLKEIGIVCELYDLRELVEDQETEKLEEAGVLVIRGFLEKDMADAGFLEQLSFEWDRKYYDIRRGKVLNKHARANVCFGIEGQNPDYENKKGRIVAFKKMPILLSIYEKIKEICGEKAERMICEGNKYDNIEKNGIGWHGDAERRKVICVRLGKTMSMCFRWYHKCKPIGKVLELGLNNGDLYIMSEKAVGYDWKKRNSYTLRHAAGAQKYTKTI